MSDFLDKLKTLAKTSAMMAGSQVGLGLYGGRQMLGRGLDVLNNPDIQAGLDAWDQIAKGLPPNVQPFAGIADDALRMLGKTGAWLKSNPESLAVFTPALKQKYWDDYLSDNSELMQMFKAQRGMKTTRDQFEEAVSAGRGAVEEAMSESNPTVYSKWDDIIDIAKKKFNQYLGQDRMIVDIEREGKEGGKIGGIETIAQKVGPTTKVTKAMEAKANMAEEVKSEVLNPKLQAALKVLEGEGLRTTQPNKFVKDVAKEQGIDISRSEAKRIVKDNPWEKIRKAMVDAKLKDYDEMTVYELGNRVDAVKKAVQAPPTKTSREYKPAFDPTPVLKELSNIRTPRQVDALKRFLRGQTKAEVIPILAGKRKSEMTDDDLFESYKEFNEILDDMYNVLNKKEK